MKFDRILQSAGKIKTSASEDKLNAQRLPFCVVGICALCLILVYVTGAPCQGTLRNIEQNCHENVEIWQSF